MAKKGKERDTDSSSSRKAEVVATSEDAVTDQAGPELPDIVVNKWSLHDLKTACDDGLKQFLSRPSLYKPSHVHTDVRLVLGWTASIIAMAASGYAYKVPFWQSRDYVLAAVAVYAVLSAAMAAYTRWIERDTVFVGKRKVFASGRIETQSIHVRTSCQPYTPVYEIHLSYHHSSNGGKSLIRSFEKDTKKPFNEMFDESGKLAREALEDTLKGLLEEASG